MVKTKSEKGAVHDASVVVVMALGIAPPEPYIDDRADVDDERMQEDGPRTTATTQSPKYARRCGVLRHARHSGRAQREAALGCTVSRPPGPTAQRSLAAHLRAAPPSQMPAHMPQSPAGTPSFFAGPSTFEQACDRTPLSYQAPAAPLRRPPRTHPLVPSRLPWPHSVFVPHPHSLRPLPPGRLRPTREPPRQSPSARPPSRSPSPPRKHRRRDGPAEFLDLEASDSDKDDEEEDDAIVLTQQDLDFIDDAPLPESVRPLERPIQQRDIIDSEQLAEHYDQQAASYLQDMEAEEQDFVPLSDTAQDLARDPELRRAIEHVIAPDSAARTAFRLKRLLPAASKDAVEIGTWIRFRESRKPKPVLAFTVANNQVLLERETVRFPRPLLKANNPCVFPTIEEVAPFLGAFDEFRAVMTAARFIGPAFALQPGDRAIVLPPAGTLARADVWITQIQDFVHQGSDRLYPAESPHYRGDDAIVYRGTMPS
ncbi:hypothetical protein B0H17DRAFT_1206334 [Mycena rosella]|uniref:Uncharacterized protein n=1 Tax=Mycena rosella TaxID=1033263 RepID=A0AAD7D8T5_MYCRO|nr:hypothetical protein B0H17DRAFT_1206334 [Mycena rosella]